jgi:hypothetical protein
VADLDKKNQTIFINVINILKKIFFIQIIWLFTFLIKIFAEHKKRNELYSKPSSSFLQLQASDLKMY